MRLLCSALLIVLAGSAYAANDPLPTESFDYFFKNQKELREKAKAERQQFLYPKGERFTSNPQEKDTIIAMRWYAVAGDPESQASLADLFAKGLYEPHNIKSAMTWYELAAQNGNIYGMYMAGLGYQLGWLGTPDAVRANEYFRTANLNDDSPRARRQVAQFFMDRDNALYNFDEAYRWFEMAAEEGDIDAQLTLADLHIDGRHTGKNPLLAMKWYGRAAAKLNPYAQYSLGVIYLQGEEKIIKPDYNQAVMWIEKSACGQFAAAQGLLGRLYYNGKGVPQNNALAYAWWMQANQNPNPTVQAEINQVIKKMSVDEMEQAVKLADFYRVNLAQGCDLPKIKQASLKGANYLKGAQYRPKIAN
jgi:TPR repeat protein